MLLTERQNGEHSRLFVERATARALALVVALFLPGCDPSPEVAEGKPLPICPATGRAFTVQQLTDIVVLEEMKTNISWRCTVHYSTLDQFYARNPKCCKIDLRHRLFEQEPIAWRYLGSLGYLLGNIQVEYICDNSGAHVPAKFSESDFNITSCGAVAERTSYLVEFHDGIPYVTSGESDR